MEKLNKNSRFPFVIFQASLCLIALLLFEFGWNGIDFQLSCVLGTIFSALSLLNLLLFKKKIIDPIVIFYIAFILFQYGLPIIRAFNPNFYNYYLSLFSDENLLYCSNITILCILFAGLGIIIIAERNSNHKSNILCDEHRKMIWNIFAIIALVTGVVSIYTQFRIIGYARAYGYNYVKVDTMGITSSLTRLTDALFIPSLILLIVFSDNKWKSFISIVVALVFAILNVFGGGRTVALGLILAIGYHVYIKYLLPRFGKISILIVLVGGFIVAYLAVFIAAYRQDYSTNFTFGSVISSVFEEMGFNFTSICFTRLYVNQSTGFFDGQTYFNSLILLVPKSIDSTGYIDSLFNNIPETWLAAKLETTYGTFFEWGVGYSLIAEAYMNFGDYAYLAIFVIAFLLTWLIDKNQFGNTKLFSQYIKTVMTYALLTAPRRSLYTTLKEIEYDIILFVVIIAVIMFIAPLFKNNDEVANEQVLV